MVDEVTTPEGTPEGTGYTDEQIAAAFPGQDVAHARAMMDKMAGKGTPVSPNADGPGGKPDAAVQNNADTQSTEVQYPDYIPEKFRQGSLDEAHRKMAESYAVLEGARGQGAEGAVDTGAAAADTAVGDAADNADDANPPTLNLGELEGRWVANQGQLTNEDYAEAEKAGMSRQVVDSYLAGQQALAEQMVTKVHTMAGGEDTYTQMLQWADKNWSEDDTAQFDAAVTSGDLKAIGLAVKALKADYVAANGKAPNLVPGDSDANSEAQGYQSKAEMTAAIKDPRYRKDPAYRAEVARKIHVGNVWGNR